MTMLDKVKMHFPKMKMLGSALYQEDDFRYFIEKALTFRAVEIGTQKGLATCLMSDYADEIFTFDIADFSEKYLLWRKLNCEKKIKAHIVKDNGEKKKIIDGLEFDFAFIDASHKFDDVQFDFGLVKRCGRVLFHDYRSEKIKMREVIEVKEFVDTIKDGRLEIREPFAYWTAE